MNEPFVANHNSVQLVTRDSIVLSQSEYQRGCEWLCCCLQIEPDVVSWRYVPPTPTMEQRGLTAAVLQSELATIQNVFADKLKIDTKRLSIAAICSLCMLIAGGIAIPISYRCVDEEDGYCWEAHINWVWVGVAIFGFLCLFVCAIINSSRKSQALLDALEAVRRYVEIALNAKYQQTNGIRWEIVEEKMVLVRTSNQGTTTTNIRYYHIGVSCISLAQQTAPNVAFIVVNPEAQSEAADIDVAEASQEIAEGSMAAAT